MTHKGAIHTGILFAVIAALGLGSVTTQAKLVYADGGNAITLMLFRFGFSCLIFAAMMKQAGIGFGVSRPNRVGVLAVGLVWSGSMIAYLFSVETISVSLAVLILYTYPMIVLLVGALSGQAPFTPLRGGLFAAAFVGLCLAIFDGGDLKLGWGALFAVAAALGAAFTFVKGARLAPKVDAFVLSFWVNAAGLGLILPLVAFDLALPRSTIPWLALGGATACYVVAIVSQFQALARLPAARAAFVFNLEPLVSVLLAVFILSEQLGHRQWLGVALVLGAVAVNSLLGESSGRAAPIERDSG